jgi:uncharacterized protein (DUF1786 family)
MIRKYTREGKDIVISGDTMGGGAITSAIFAHVKKGLNVYMTELSAYTIRDDLQYVKSKGVKIIHETAVQKYQEKCACIHTSDIDTSIIRLLQNLGFETEPEIVAVCVEDHGIASENQTDRECRFQHFKELIPGNTMKFSYKSPPEYYSRMCAVKRMLASIFPDSEHLIIDSKISAVFGIMFASSNESMISVDIGNGHTTVAAFEHRNLTGLFEHHTRMLTPEKFEIYMEKFIDGTLTNKTIFNDGGHGCYIHNVPKCSDIYVSGPRKDLIKTTNLDYTFVNPAGDCMLAGIVGLVECAKSVFPYFHDCSSSDVLKMMK